MFRCPKFDFERSVWTCSNFFSPLQKTSFELKGFKKILHAFWPQGHHHHAIAFKIRNDTKMQMKVQNKKSTTAADEKSCRTAEKRSCCRMYAITLSNHKILTCKKKAFLQFSKGIFSRGLQKYSRITTSFSDAAAFCVFRKVVKFSWDASSSSESLSWNAAKDIIKFLRLRGYLLLSPPPLSPLPSKQKWKQQSVVEQLLFLLRRCVSIIGMLLSHPSFWLLGT